jgi:hypothetical protein
LPSGSSRLWSGPATKPSSEIDMWQVVCGIGVLSVNFATKLRQHPKSSETEFFPAHGSGRFGAD